MAYNSTRILQLLKICSWKSGSNLDHNGFRTLADNLDAKIRNAGFNANENVPDQKYLGQLLLDVNKNIKSGSDTGRNSNYIKSILNYLDFPDWGAFCDRMTAADTSLDLSKIDTSKYEQATISFFVDQSILNEVKQSIAFAEKTTNFQILFHKIDASKSDELLQELDDLTMKSQFVVWGVTNNWDGKLPAYKDSPNLRAILDKGQVIPVRIGETFLTPNMRFSFKKESRPPYGGIGLLMALAAIECNSIQYSETEKVKKSPLGGKINIGTFINKGTVATGDMKQENHGGNNVLGGNIIQNFPGKED